MTKRLLVTTALALTVLCIPQGASAQEYVPDEVIVKYRQDVPRSLQEKLQQAVGTQLADVLPGGSKELEIADGESVRETIAELRRNPNVLYAVPNYIAKAAWPNDPGWSKQWNYWGTFGIRAPEAWSIASSRGAPAGNGILVAVIDSGVAYRDFGTRYRKAPDFNPKRFVSGYDFVARDRYPYDMLGHGTHVAGTIGQWTNNRVGAAGVAGASRIMPVRVLDAQGEGDAAAVSQAIRFSVAHRARIINLSLEFGTRIRASQIPDVLSALRYARSRGVVTIAAAGNEGAGAISYPARYSTVLAVGGTTKRGCQADYSNSGRELDVVAPGGGEDASNRDNSWDSSHCRSDVYGPDIYQQTFTRRYTSFGLPAGYVGTSMATAHVSGVAALLIGSGRLGSTPSVSAVEQRLKATARDLGPRGFDSRYGSGLVNAAAALR